MALRKIVATDHDQGCIRKVRDAAVEALFGIVFQAVNPGLARPIAECPGAAVV
jgi:hypothetical protein